MNTAPLHLSITPATLGRLDVMRQLQIARFTATYYRENRKMPSPDDSNMDREWLAVRFGENGPERMIREHLLSKWARTFGNDNELLSLTLCPNGLLVLKHGTSTLSTYTAEIESTKESNVYVGYSQYNPLLFIDCLLIPLSVNSIGVLTVNVPLNDGEETELSTLKAEVAAARKALVLGKQYVKAQKVERETWNRFVRATEEVDAAKALLASMTLQDAINQARRILAARRLWKRTMEDLTVIPSWLPFPSTFEADELINGEFTKRATEVHAYLVKLIAPYLDAIAGRQAYKPRLSWPSYVQWEGGPKAIAAFKKTNPHLASQVYGPAFGKLKETEDKARRQVEYFLRDRFSEYCVAQGLPVGEDIMITWIPDSLRPYSRAKLLVKEWEASQCVELESLYLEAKAKRKKLEEETETTEKRDEE